MNRRFNM